MDIKALGYLGFESPQAKACESFGPEIFGLRLGEPGTDRTIYLRMDDRHHRIAIGRHTMDTLVSFYMRTPSGFDIEFGAGGALHGDDVVQINPSHSEIWGHKPMLKRLGTDRDPPAGLSRK